MTADQLHQLIAQWRDYRAKAAEVGLAYAGLNRAIEAAGLCEGLERCIDELSALLAAPLPQPAHASEAASAPRTEEYPPGNWHAIEGANGMCACGPDEGCHARLRRWIRAHQLHQPAPEKDVQSYHVEPDKDGAGDWHVLTFGDGRRVMILTQHPLVIVDTEVH